MEQLNPEIFKKIESAMVSDKLKTALKALLKLEFENSEESRWQYKEKYEEIIKKGIK